MSKPELQARQIAISALARAIADKTPINAAQVNELAGICGFSKENVRKHLQRAGLRQDNHSLAMPDGLAGTLAYWWEQRSTERMTDEQAVLLTRKFANGEVHRDIDLGKIRQTEEASLAYLAELHEARGQAYDWRDWRAGQAERERIDRMIDAYVAQHTLPRYGVEVEVPL